MLLRKPPKAECDSDLLELQMLHQAATVNLGKNAQEARAGRLHYRLPSKRSLERN